MAKITVVDARMGRGKSTAAIRYMNEHKDTKRFIYITPYLSEVNRVGVMCDFEEPAPAFAKGTPPTSKSALLKSLIAHGDSVTTTHALFNFMDEEALALASERNYSLVIDESIQVIRNAPIHAKDLTLLFDNYLSVDGDEGFVKCRPEAEGYEGVFSGFIDIAHRGSLYYRGKALYELMNPQRFLAFDEVFILTYRFEGQLMKAYLDYHEMPYTIVGVEEDEEGYFFSDKPDVPPPTDYSQLIRIFGDDINSRDAKLNEIGKKRTALSASWFRQRSPGHADIKKLSNHLRNFFIRKTDSKAGTRLWTTFKERMRWLDGQRHIFASGFLSLNARATNAYRETRHVAYLANRFVDPNISKFFAAKGIAIDQDEFALAEMLQFIWRSAIRDNEPIDLYIPSSRMRDLLKDWIEEASAEVVAA